jgi:hypothetical protein
MKSVTMGSMIMMENCARKSRKAITLSCPTPNVSLTAPKNPLRCGEARAQSASNQPGR